MIRSFRGIAPRIAASAYIDPSAQIIGEVVIGERSSVWPHTSVRGDTGLITIGSESNIQDNCSLHMDTGFPLTIGDRVTVGHGVMLHGCRIESHCLIGMRATLMNDAVVGEYSIIGAGAVVTERTVIPPRSLVLGLPARVKRPLTDQEVAGIDEYARRYYEYKETYLAMKAQAQ